MALPKWYLDNEAELNPSLISEQKAKKSTANINDKAGSPGSEVAASPLAVQEEGRALAQENSLHFITKESQGEVCCRIKQLRPESTEIQPAPISKLKTNNKQTLLGQPIREDRDYFILKRKGQVRSSDQACVLKKSLLAESKANRRAKSSVLQLLKDSLGKKTDA